MKFGIRKDGKTAGLRIAICFTLVFVLGISLHIRCGAGANGLSIERDDLADSEEEIRQWAENLFINN